MSNFEFMRNFPFGQYLPVDSWLNRLDPRARIISFFIFFIAIIIANHAIGFLIGLIFIVICLIIGKVPAKMVFRGILVPLPFLIILAILQVFINFSQDYSPIILNVGPFEISKSDIWTGIFILFRFFALILSLILVSFCVSTSELTNGLGTLLKPVRKVGIPSQDIILTIQITLRYIPILIRAAEHIAKAQASRGLDWDTMRGGIIRRARLVIPLLVPIFITSLRRAEQLAMAIDARGYSGSNQRTSMHEYQFELEDYLAILFTFIISVIMIWFRNI